MSKRSKTVRGEGVDGVRTTRRAKHLQDNEWYLGLEFGFQGQAPEEAFISLADARETRFVKSFLLKRGFWPGSEQHMHKVLEHIRGELPKEVCFLTNKLGWHVGEEHGVEYAAYALAGRCIKVKGPEVIFFEAARRASGTCLSGTLEEWQEHLAVPAAASSYAVFVICAALAAYLLHFTDVESGVFHLGGPSAAGKTTLARVAASVTPEGPAAVRNWNRTPKSFGALFLRHNDGFLILDDLALASPGKSQQREALHAFAYELTATETRQYSPLLDRVAPQGTYRLLGLSTGENSAAEIAKHAGEPRLSGEEARFIDLPARTAKTGVFDRLKKAGHRRTATSSAMLAKALNEAAKTYYGTAGPAFIERLVENQDRACERIERYMEAFLDEARVPAGGWERRFALKFAIVYAAGRLASRCGILPWSERLIFDHVKRTYQRARGAVPTTAAETTTMVERLKDLLGEDRLLDLVHAELPPDTTAVNDADALRLVHKGEVRLAITPEALRSLGRKPDVERLLQQIDKVGQLVRPPEYPRHKTWQVKPQKGASRRRFYIIGEKVLTLDLDNLI